MHQMLFIESRTPGVLMVNGFFCGPLEADGQAFPTARDGEIFIQLFPFFQGAQPLTTRMRLSDGRIEQLEPQEAAYALLWPDGIIQLELMTGGQQENTAPAQADGQPSSSATLLRYLNARITGDAQADALLMRPQDSADVSGYDAAIPLRFAPMHAPERYDERAGLVKRLAPNVARVDAALASTVPAGQGRRMIERVEIMRT